MLNVMMRPAPCRYSLLILDLIETQETGTESLASSGLRCLALSVSLERHQKPNGDHAYHSDYELFNACDFSCSATLLSSHNSGTATAIIQPLLRLADHNRSLQQWALSHCAGGTNHGRHYVNICYYHSAPITSRVFWN